MIENYNKHSVNTTLTEAGAKQVFYRENRLTRNNSQQEQVKSIYNEQRKKVKQNVSKENQKEKLNDIKMEEQSVLAELKAEEKQLKNEIENFYLQKEEVLTKEGKADKRYKKRLTSEEIEQYTQKGEQRMTARQAKEAGMTVKKYNSHKKLVEAIAKNHSHEFIKYKDKATEVAYENAEEISIYNQGYFH